MARVGYDKYDERKWAFTENPNDIRSNLFTKTLSKMGKTEVNSDSLMFDLMTAKNYEENTKNGGAIKYNHVHPEFTNFIIKSAFFHREIDKATDIDTRLADVRETLRDYINIMGNPFAETLISKNDGTGAKDIRLLLDFDDTTEKYNKIWVHGDKQLDNSVHNKFQNASGNGIDWFDLVLADAGNAANKEFLLTNENDTKNNTRGNTPLFNLPKITIKDHINPTQASSDLALLVASIVGRSVSGLNSLDPTVTGKSFVNLNAKEIVDAIKKSNFFYNNKKTYNDFVDLVLGTGDTATPNGIISLIMKSFGVATRETGPNKGPVTGSNGAKYLRHDLDYVIKELEGKHKTNNRRREKIIDEMKKVITNWAENIATETIEGALLDSSWVLTEKAQLLRSNEPKWLTIIKKAVNDDILISSYNNKWKTRLTDLSGKLFDAINNIIKQDFDPGYTTTSGSKPSKKLYEEVYKNWDKLTDSAQAFYNKYITYMVRKGGRWIEIRDESEYGKADNLNKVRLNFNKKGNSDTLEFESDLPDLPYHNNNFLVESIWYTDYKEQLREIVTGGWSKSKKDFFRILYKQVYRHSDKDLKPPGNKLEDKEYLEISLYANDLQLPTTLEKAENVYKVPRFNLNIDKLIRRRLFRISQAEVGVPDIEPDDYNYTNLIDNNTWKRGRDGEFVKVVDGKEVSMGVDDKATRDLLKATSHQCYSSLFKGTKGNLSYSV
jgi:hypothetical protein